MHNTRNDKKIEFELKKLFSELEQNSIEYCILHPNTGQLDYETDVDICVKKIQFDELKQLLLEQNWKQQISHRYKGIKYFFYLQIEGFKLKLDVTTNVAVFFQDMYYELIDPKFERCDQTSLVYLSDKNSYQMILLKMLLLKKFNLSKIELLNKIASKLNREDLHINQNTLDQKYLRKEVDTFFNSESKGKKSYSILFIAYLKRMYFLKAPLKIAFVGLDGAGKSTYIEKLENSLLTNNQIVKSIYLGHSAFKFKLTKALYKLKSKTKNRLILNVLRLCYCAVFPVELLCRKGLGRYDVIIMDRHPIFEPILPTGPLLNIYNRFINFIAPKPDVVIYLNGNENILWNRKKEMEFEVYQKKNKKLKHIVSTLPPEVIIRTINSTTDTIEHVFVKVWKSIFNESK